MKSFVIFKKTCCSLSRHDLDHLSYGVTISKNVYNTDNCEGNRDLQNYKLYTVYLCNTQTKIRDRKNHRGQARLAPVVKMFQKNLCPRFKVSVSLLYNFFFLRHIQINRKHKAYWQGKEVSAGVCCTCNNPHLSFPFNA